MIEQSHQQSKVHSVNVLVSQNLSLENPYQLTVPIGSSPSCFIGQLQCLVVPLKHHQRCNRAKKLPPTSLVVCGVFTRQRFWRREAGERFSRHWHHNPSTPRTRRAPIRTHLRGALEQAINVITRSQGDVLVRNIRSTIREVPLRSKIWQQLIWYSIWHY